MPRFLRLRGRLNVPLSIPLRMKLSRLYNRYTDEYIFQFLWGWNVQIEGDEERKGWISFNSFEDETEEWYCNWDLIPMENFQFLWGWNIEQQIIEIAHEFSFQFLWGWNTISAVESIKDTTLSIPLRMKQRGLGSALRYGIKNFQFLWGWNPM